MKWQYCVAGATLSAAFVAAGCAANSPAEAPDPAVATSTVAASSPAPAVESQAPVAEAAEPLLSNDDGGIIEALPAAAPRPTPVAAYAAPQVARLVCSYERRTGSNRKVKVCRKPPSALDRDETQRTFDSLRRSQMGEPR